MSTFTNRNGSSGEGKGPSAEASIADRAVVAGSSENICRTVTFRGVLSFWTQLALLPLVAVNVEFLRIRGFLFAE